MACGIAVVITFLLCQRAGVEVSRSLEMVTGTAKVGFHQDLLFRNYFAF